jgi:diguanylate cyclase (GGDEF)-like protein
MTTDAVNVLLVGFDGDLEAELVAEEGFSVERAGRLADVKAGTDTDAVVVALEETGPLEALEILRTSLPDAAIIVVTDPGQETDGTVALHAGAEDQLVSGSIPPGLLPRSVRYAIAQRGLRRELVTEDPISGLMNLRGFAPIAEHHIKMANRSHTPVVFLFMRLEGLASVAAKSATESSALARGAAEVLLDAVRDSDVPARLSADTFCVLLTGGARGAEMLVLSRLIEAIAVQNAQLDSPGPISLSVGSALYDPEHPDTLGSILETADRRLTDQHTSSDLP